MAPNWWHLDWGGRRANAFTPGSNAHIKILYPTTITSFRAWLFWLPSTHTSGPGSFRTLGRHESQGDPCPDCGAELVYRYISLNEKLLLCPASECFYPFDITEDIASMCVPVVNTEGDSTDRRRPMSSWRR